MKRKSYPKNKILKQLKSLKQVSCSFKNSEFHQIRSIAIRGIDWVPAMPGATPASGSASKPIYPESSISGSNYVE